jgi:TetR/AcrR family transcriptional regulator, cholesterol catabolism regulator
MATKSERTRQRILDAAANALATRGYAATSLNAIAASIGMQDASLYYHFGSKDDLVTEVLRLGTLLAEEAVAVAVGDLGPEPDPVDALAAAIVAHAAAVLGGGDYPRANVRSYGQLPPHLAEAHIAQHRRYGDVWRGLIEAGVEAGRIRQDLDPDAVRLLVVGALNWAIEWYDPDGSLTPAELGRQLVAMVLGGLLVDPAGPGATGSLDLRTTPDR